MPKIDRNQLFCHYFAITIAKQAFAQEVLGYVRIRFRLDWVALETLELGVFERLWSSMCSETKIVNSLTLIYRLSPENFGFAFNGPVTFQHPSLITTINQNVPSIYDLNAFFTHM